MQTYSCQEGLPRAIPLIQSVVTASSALLAAGLITTLSPYRAYASDIIASMTTIDLKVGQVEGLDVSKDGGIIAVTSPVELDDGSFDSSIERVFHRPATALEFLETFITDVRGGELTDVAIGPNGYFLAANIRDDSAFDGNQLVIVRANGVAKRIDLPGSADGIGLSPDGNRLVVAGEKYEAIDIYDTDNYALHVKLLKRIGPEELLPHFTGDHAARLADSDIEPEAVVFSPDGNLAFVSLQEQSSIAIIHMPSLALLNVVHLPFGFLAQIDVDELGEPVYGTFGVQPDGLGVTPDGRFLIAANEPEPEATHLQGISILDLRYGPTSIPEPRTYCIFDIDPTLLDGTGLAQCPIIPPGVPPSAEQTEDLLALPRLDPNSSKTVVRGGRSITAVNIERRTRAQDRGSVLFLDTSALEASGDPTTIERVLVGLNRNSRPEGLRVSNDGQYIWIGLQNDGGTIVRFEMK